MDPRAWRRFRKNKGAIAGGVLVLLVSATAFIGPFLAPHNPDEQFENGLRMSDGAPVGPSAQFPLGADQVGRDFLSRLLHGGAVSMQVAIFATALAVIVGLFVGITSGYFRGTPDMLAMRGVDLLNSLPFLLIVIAINRVIDSPALWTLYILLGLLSWTTLARITRSKTMQVSELEFVQAARALGMSETRIVLRHVFPNVASPAIVIGTTLVAQMIIAESAMSFLGLGVRPPAASWGTMLSDGQGMMTTSPWLVAWPAALIVAAVFGFNLLGEGLRDAFDAKA